MNNFSVPSPRMGPLAEYGEEWQSMFTYALDTGSHVDIELALCKALNATGFVFSLQFLLSPSH